MIALHWPVVGLFALAGLFVLVGLVWLCKGKLKGALPGGLTITAADREELGKLRQISAGMLVGALLYGLACWAEANNERREAEEGARRAEAGRAAAAVPWDYQLRLLSGRDGDYWGYIVYRCDSRQGLIDYVVENDIDTRFVRSGWPRYKVWVEQGGNLRERATNELSRYLAFDRYRKTRR